MATKNVVSCTIITILSSEIATFLSQIIVIYKAFSYPNQLTTIWYRIVINL
jgi:hypothetical protein